MRSKSRPKPLRDKTLRAIVEGGYHRDVSIGNHRVTGMRDLPALHLGLLALVAASLAAPVVCQGQTVSPGRTEVIGELKKGNPQAALSLATKALQRSPHDCGLLSLKAVALTSLGQPEPALASFHSALTYCPAYLPALEGAVQIEYAQHGSETVLLLERILALRPEDPTANAMLATTLRAQGKCEDALAHYTASEPLFPSRPDLLQGYGTCLADTGDLKAALSIYEELLASNPDPTVRYDVALLQWRTHANDDALATLTPLLTGSPEAPVLALAAKLHEEKGETPQAVDLLRQAILKAPDNIDNYLDFAAIAFAHKSFQVGIDILNAGLNRLPNTAALYVARGVLEVQLSKGDAAITDFEQAHRLDPKLSFAVDAIGIMQSQKHQNAESSAVFETQAKQHGDDPLLQYLLAEQLSESADDAGGTRSSDAIAAAQRAVTLDPKYQAAHDLLALLYVRANQPELAIQQAEMALALDRNDQNALYQEIIARRRSGNTSQVQALTKRLDEARKENERKQQNSDRYRLQDEANH